MEVINDLKASTETPKIKQATDGKVNATTDGSNTYASLEIFTRLFASKKSCDLLSN